MSLCVFWRKNTMPDSKVHGAHVGPMHFAIWDVIRKFHCAVPLYSTPCLILLFHTSLLWRPLFFSNQSCVKTYFKLHYLTKNQIIPIPIKLLTCGVMLTWQTLSSGRVASRRMIIAFTTHTSAQKLMSAHLLATETICTGLEDHNLHIAKIPKPTLIRYRSDA